MGRCNDEIEARIENHPCYSEKAHHFFARMHLPVAPGCNIQCNYCNRKYDCSNESRPGVVSERLKPEDALKRVYHAADKLKELSVIGIAGPGDALANPRRTFKTLRLIKEHFPDLQLCLSTNGLALPDSVDEIVGTGVEHVTVTVNTFKPESAARIYEWVLYQGRKSSSLEAMEHFLDRQQEGIRELTKRGVLVKVNSILIPGINDLELPVISRKLKLMGVFMHNIMPLIAKPEHGTAFGLQRWPEPLPKQLEIVRESCGNLKQMAHCRQCRADAVGLLGEDTFKDFEMKHLPDTFNKGDSGREKRDSWKDEVRGIMNREMPEKIVLPHQEQGKAKPSSFLIAVCTKGMGIVNEHFGHAKEFHVYRVSEGKPMLLNVRKVQDQYCEGDASCGDKKSALENILETIKDCDAVVSAKVGYKPHKTLEEHGVVPITDLAYMPIEEAVVRAAERLASGIKAEKPSLLESIMQI